MAREMLSANTGLLACHDSALRAQTMYGIRQYYRGSILKKHVDRIETHIISCILNVAQDVDSDWELEVLDHKGKLRRVAQKVQPWPPKGPALCTQRCLSYFPADPPALSA
jgi:hypothetical protein